MNNLILANSKKKGCPNLDLQQTIKTCCGISYTWKRMCGLVPYTVFKKVSTWTISRGCTDRVGKFPRPWMGTASPRIESKRCTWSQDNTQNRRLWSDASPQDIAMLTLGSPQQQIKKKDRKQQNMMSSVSSLFSKTFLWMSAVCRSGYLSLSAEKLVEAEVRVGQPFLPVRAALIRSVCKAPIHLRV